MGAGHVLVVDEREERAALYARWLGEAYTVDTATDGDYARAMLSEQPDVVLVDRQLAGAEAVAALQDPDLECHAALLTATDPVRDVVASAFDEHLTKPISKDVLHETVDRLLSRATRGPSRHEPRARRAAQAAVEDEGTAAVLQAPFERAHQDKHGDAVMDRVSERSLPAPVMDVVEEYEAKIGVRDRFLLKWLHAIFPAFTPTEIADCHAEQVRTTKTLASMFVMLLDDLGEHHDDPATLAEVAKLPFLHETSPRATTDIDAAYVEVSESVWETLQTGLADSPCYEEFADLLRHDLRKVIHAIRYSAMVSARPEMANLCEATTTDAHNMMMLVYADIDLMYLPSFAPRELGALRELILKLQQMARIGNWITTWERELTEGDFSSGVVLYALENDIIAPEDLDGVSADAESRAAVTRAIREAGVEEVLFEQWEERCTRLRDTAPNLDSIDVEHLIDGMQEVMAFHLASRGRK